MRRLYRYLPPFAGDYSGVCSVLYELGGMICIHDAAGCTGNYTGFDEPRSYNSRTLIYCAFLLGIGCVALVYSISRIKGQSSMIMIILAGMVISSLFEAMVSLIKYTADPQDQLPQITFWLMGSMSGVGFGDLLLGCPFILAGIVIIFMLRWKMNTLSLHEDEARSLGVNVNFIRLWVIIAATMITAAVVSICGKVGWVGLLIPHIARMIFGNNNKRVIPASIGLGAVFMVIIDTVARSTTSTEIPISILTAVIGAPFFIILLRKTGGIR